MAGVLSDEQIDALLKSTGDEISSHHDPLAEEIERLKLENEMLVLILKQSIKFYTAEEYSKAFNKNWNFTKCQLMGTNMLGHCLPRSIKIKRSGDANSYPLSAWESLFGKNSTDC